MDRRKQVWSFETMHPLNHLQARLLRYESNSLILGASNACTAILFTVLVVMFAGANRRNPADNCVRPSGCAATRCRCICASSCHAVGTSSVGKCCNARIRWVRSSVGRWSHSGCVRAHANSCTSDGYRYVFSTFSRLHLFSVLIFEHIISHRGTLLLYCITGTCVLLSWYSSTTISGCAVSLTRNCVMYSDFRITVHSVGLELHGISDVFVMPSYKRNSMLAVIFYRCFQLWSPCYDLRWVTDISRTRVWLSAFL